MKKKIIDQDLRDAAGKSATESHPICMVTVDDSTFDTNHYKMIAHYHGFIAGTEWHEEQSATDAIEMLNWLIKNDHLIMIYDGVIQHKHLSEVRSKELHELWNQTKEN